MPKLRQGLRPLKQDIRDFKLGAIYHLPESSELPEEFILEGVIIEDQSAHGEDDFCSAYSSCSASELQEGVKLSRRFSFAVSKELSGDRDEWGQDLRTAMASHCKVGAVAETDLNDKELLMDSTLARDIKNYRAGLKPLAVKHVKKTYIKVGDSYEEIRKTIWRFRDEKRAVVFGVEWGWDLNDYILKGINSGFGHAILAIGWTKDGLLIANSAGETAGRGGLHILPKETVDYFLPRFGAFVFVDASKEHIEWLMKNQINSDDDLLLQLLKLIKNLIKKLYAYFH